ncbi:hypothetical protein ACFL2V_15200 [Pseudomonadota bacterium]
MGDDLERNRARTLDATGMEDPDADLEVVNEEDPDAIQYIIPTELLEELAKEVDLDALRSTLGIVNVDVEALRNEFKEQAVPEEQKVPKAARLSDIALRHITIDFDEVAELQSGGTSEDSSVRSIVDLQREHHEAAMERVGQAGILPGPSPTENLDEETPNVLDPVCEGLFDLKTDLLYKHLSKETYLLLAIGVDLGALLGAVERFRLVNGTIDIRHIVGICERLYQGLAARILIRLNTGDTKTVDRLDEFASIQTDIMHLRMFGSRKLFEPDDVNKHLGAVLAFIDSKKTTQIAGTDEVYERFIRSEDFKDAILA